MSELVVRKIPFCFDGVEFIWNPQNPEFSLLANVLSFQTIGFERFICKSMHEAHSYVKDLELQREIKDFNAQEMAHSQAHMKHVRSMIDRYPALQDVFDESLADFDTHWNAHDLTYRLAYSAIIEATSLPLYKVILNHRRDIFTGGDSRVTSLLLWHFCEEIEHRASALRVYNHVVERPWGRLRAFPQVGGHLAGNTMRIAKRFAEIVPGVADLDIRRATARLPRWARVNMAISLVTSQLPWYNPGGSRVPDYCGEWATRFAAGEDMRIVSMS